MSGNNKSLKGLEINTSHIKCPLLEYSQNTTLGRDVGIYLDCNINNSHTVRRRFFGAGYGDNRWI
jgi:hypothetical protein